MPAVEVEELQVRYGERLAVDKVSFAVEPGEVVAIIGPNGAGKTSTVEVLEGYRRRSGGSVRVLGLDPRADHTALSGRIGVMLQKGGAYPVMSPARLVALFSSYYRRPRPGDELTELLGLGAVASTPFKRLSGGEQQRTLMALALVGRPEVVFLDEPTAGVDPSGRATVRQVVSSLKGEGVAVLLTSHELEEIERTADRVVLMSRGQVVAAGEPSRLGGAEAIRFAVEGSLDLDRLSAALGHPVRENGVGRYLVEGSADPETVAALTRALAEHDVTLRELTLGTARLEEVFFSLTKEES